IIGLIAYLALGKKNNTDQTSSVESNSQTADTASEASQSTATPQSLKSLLAAGTAQKCSFSDSGSQGTFYVSAGKARGDFTTTASGKTTATHMIVDGQTSYIWMDGQSQGFKMMADASAQANVNAQQAIDANKPIGYSCSAWSADSSMFVLPTG